MSEELKPCPFCGGEAKRFTIGKDEPNNAGGDVIVCMRCQASSHVEFGRKENLVSYWNRRATPSQQLDAATVERCAQVIRDWHPDEEAAGCDATWADCKYALLASVTALATEPHQHGGKGA